MQRRELLRHAGLVTVGLAATPIAGWPRSWFRRDDVVVPFTDVPANFTTRPSPNPERFLGQNLISQDLRALTEFVTPVEDFFAVAHYGYPEIDPTAYRLRVHGRIERPFSLNLDALRALPRAERTTTFECAGNSRARFQGMVGNATWGGTRLAPLLEEAGYLADAREVHFLGADSGTEELRGAQYQQYFGRSMSVAELLEADPILAWEMNGEPLTIVHGFPVRLIVPGWYGVAQVKWLDRIEVSPDRLMTRFMARDYVTIMGHEIDGETVWTETSVTRQRIKSAIARVTRNEDRFRIFGVAYNDGTPLDRVEVRIDDGPWQRAELDNQGNPFAWSFFTLDTTGLAPGEHTLVSRATDRIGRTQPEQLDLKRTRWENNELFSRTIEVG